MERQVLGAGPVDPIPAAPEPRYMVAIVEPDAHLRLMLAGQLPSGARQCQGVDDLATVLRPGHPTVAVFGPSLVGPLGFEQVHRLSTAYPEVGPIFAAYELTTDLLQHALRAGARDAVQIDESGDALAQAVVRVGEVLHAPARGMPLVAAPASGAVLATRTPPGRLIAVFSTKGGVGKTTIATNVAAAMARAVDDPVTLMDADLQFGDVSVMLGLPPDHTVVDAAASIHYADPDLMRSLVTRHDSGLLVLPAPSEPLIAGGISPEEMTAVAVGLQAISRWVIVDVPTNFDDTTLGLLEAADEVLLVASMDIPSVKNLKIGMQALDLMAIAGPKLRLVLNRANAQVKLDVREVEHVLGLRAAFPVPYDLAVPLSINAGVPVVMRDPRCAASRALEHVAASLLGPAADGAKGRGRRRSRRKPKH